MPHEQSIFHTDLARYFSHVWSVHQHKNIPSINVGLIGNTQNHRPKDLVVYIYILFFVNIRKFEIFYLLVLLLKILGIQTVNKNFLTPRPTKSIPSLDTAFSSLPGTGPDTCVPATKLEVVTK